MNGHCRASRWNCHGPRSTNNPGAGQLAAVPLEHILPEHVGELPAAAALPLPERQRPFMIRLAQITRRLSASFPGSLPLITLAGVKIRRHIPLLLRRRRWPLPRKGRLGIRRSSPLTMSARWTVWTGRPAASVFRP